MKFKKSQGIAINTVILLILGIFLFGAGFFLFTEFFSEGEKLIGDLTVEVKTDISNLECKDDLTYLCIPKLEIKNGEKDVFHAVVINQKNTKENFALNLELEDLETGFFGVESECGKIYVNYYRQEIEISSLDSVGFPIEISASKVNKFPCSFVIKANLTRGVETVDRDAVLVSVMK